jgi:hypothetical protein
VVTREGRAVKLEGNPEHTVNKGKLCSRGQARCRASTIPGASGTTAKQGGAFADLTWTRQSPQAGDQIRLREPVGGALRAGAGTFSTCSGMDRGAGRTRHPVAAARSRCHPDRPTPACSGSTGARPRFCRARHRLVRADFLETSLAPIQNQAGLRRESRLPEQRDREGGLSGRAVTSPASTPTSGTRWHPAARRCSRSRWPT